MNDSYPVFINGTRVIPQPNCCLVYSWERATFDVFNFESLIFLNEMQRNASSDEIVRTVSTAYPDASEELVENDLRKLQTFLQARGYIELSVSPGENSNLFECADRLGELKVVQADVEITKNCNLRCRYCFDEAGAGSPTLPLGRWIELLDSLHNAGLRIVKVSGGEPFLYPGILDLLEYAQGKFIVSINTNGYFIDEEVAGRLASMHLQAVQVSLDSTRAEVHDFFRGDGSWDRAMSAIDLLARAGVPLRISTTATTQNVGELDDIRELARAYGAELSVEVLKKVGKASDMDSEYFIANPEMLSHHSEKSDTHRILDELAITCQAQLGIVGISFRGNIKPCNLTEEFFEERGAEVVEGLDGNWSYADSLTLANSNAASDVVVGLMEKGVIASKDKCIFEY